MEIVYEVADGTGWREVSAKEYKSFQGRKRVRPKGINPMFYAVTNLLIAYRNI